MDWQAAAKVMAMALGAIDEIVSKASGMKASDQKQKYVVDAITLIGAILETVTSGEIADFDPDKARRELDSLLLDISDNDAAADKAITDKFGQPGKD